MAYVRLSDDEVYTLTIPSGPPPRREHPATRYLQVTGLSWDGMKAVTAYGHWLDESSSGTQMEIIEAQVPNPAFARLLAAVIAEKEEKAIALRARGRRRAGDYSDESF